MLFRSLRVRLVRDSIAHVAELPPHDRTELTRLLRRAGVHVDNKSDDKADNDEMRTIP